MGIIGISCVRAPFGISCDVGVGFEFHEFMRIKNVSSVRGNFYFWIMDFVETEREVEDIVSDENPEENELLNLTDDSEQQPDHEGLNHQFVNKDTEAEDTEDDTLAPRGKKRRILDDEEDEHQKQGTQRRRILDNEQNKQQEQGKQMWVTLLAMGNC